MQKRWIFCVGIACIYFADPMFLYGMNTSDIPIKKWHIRSLPKELQETILLAKNWGLLQATSNFLGMQPITLAGPDEHTSPIESIALYGDIAETKSIYSYAGWQTILWNIQTGEHILTKIERYKPWEEEGSAVLCGDKAINIMYKYTSSETVIFHSIGIWDIHTGQQLDKIKHDNNIVSLSADDNHVALVRHNGLVKIWNVDDKKDRFTIHPYKGRARSVALNQDMIAIGTNQGYIEIWDRHTRNILHWVTIGHADHSNKVTSITIHNNKVLAGSRNGTTKIWDIHTSELLHTFSGPNRHTAAVKVIAMDDDIVITGSKDCTVKIWPLKVNYQGTPENNPLLWMIYNTDIPQLNFIWRAYEATLHEQEFVISLPKKLGIIEEDESPEQTYGRIYFTFPQDIREYLRSRLTIRRYAETAIEKAYLVYKDNDCSVM